MIVYASADFFEAAVLKPMQGMDAVREYQRVQGETPVPSNFEKEKIK